MTDLISLDGILLDAAASSSEEAVALFGTMLVELGAVSKEYADAMWEREQKFSSAIGLGVAIPHGTDESRAHVKFDQLVFLRLEKEVSWGEELVKCVLGIASQGDGHVEILGNFAELVQDEDSLKLLVDSGTKEQVRDLILMHPHHN
jgi:mannitol/fructose-specific phosphotransferase system IIA component